MGRQSDLREALKDTIPGASSLTVRLGNGLQHITLNGKTVTVGANAAMADIQESLAKIDQATVETPVPEVKPAVSAPTVSGYRPGMIRAAIDQARKAQQAELDAAMSEFLAVQEQAAMIPDAIRHMTAKVKQETQDALQELAEFTNGGPL